ncbi:MAG: PadR family transcriptional regulator [Flaviflexus sp.]|nr:PadR family transcriptional regulator [Flaviflexus sp.]
MRRKSSELRKGALELVVLTLLARSPRYGGQIVEALSTRPGLELSAGTLYPLLNRLRGGGLVECEWRESPVGPPRKYYALTRKGRAAQQELVRQWNELTGAVSALVEDET